MLAYNRCDSINVAQTLGDHVRRILKRHDDLESFVLNQSSVVQALTKKWLSSAVADSELSSGTHFFGMIECPQS